MARPRIHNPLDIIAAARRLVLAAGPQAATIGGVAAASGAPSGSIYHHFGSRDGLLGACWLDALEAFQAGFARRLGESGPPGLAAALYTPRFCREDPGRARLLVLYRPRDLGSERWPGVTRERGESLAREFEEALDRFCAETFGAAGGDVRRRAVFALVDLPYAAVRRYAAVGVPPPAGVDGYIATAFTAVVAAETLPSQVQA
ncbi:MAG: TetR/AcrR family transcriptional regulator [Candidatus Dormibacteria bacterium]